MGRQNKKVNDDQKSKKAKGKSPKEQTLSGSGEYVLVIAQ